MIYKYFKFGYLGFIHFTLITIFLFLNISCDRVEQFLPVTIVEDRYQRSLPKPPDDCIDPSSTLNISECPAKKLKKICNNFICDNKDRYSTNIAVAFHSCNTAFCSGLYCYDGEGIKKIVIRDIVDEFNAKILVEIDKNGKNQYVCKPFKDF